jgi:IS1 family transposase
LQKAHKTKRSEDAPLPLLDAKQESSYSAGAGSEVQARAGRRDLAIHGGQAEERPGMKKPVDGAGDTWTWTALDADSKLIVQWFVGGRDGESANLFIDELASRLANRVQLTSDGHRAYLEAVEDAFGAGIDYAMLQKIYGPSSEGQRRYSPAECIGTQNNVIEGNPDPAHISTSYVERSNLSLRMHNRRFTRLTNAFSKKFENHCHALAHYFMFYNWVRIHKTLRVTPAMAAG